MPEPSPHHVHAVNAAAVGVGLLGLDEEWRVRWANPRAAERLGVDEPRLLGRALGELLSEPDLRERLRESIVASGRAHAPAVALGDDEHSPVIDLTVMRCAPGCEVEFVATLVDASAHAALRRELDRLHERLATSERDRTRLGMLRRELTEADRAPTIIGASQVVRRMLERVDRVAPTDATALIHGETGSGKDLVARTIHARSPRAGQAFIAVNCAALPESLIESELFGHERGAFTGAERQRLGKFELADGGTLFLDEIAELSPAAQAKLLRVLQNGAFERVGGAETVHVNVRVIAATHRDLARLVERNRFREDLFYRLNVFRIDVPPLRDRREDLRALIEFLHERHARRMGRPALPISDRSMRRVLAYRWPGNIRELENAVERATLLAEGPALEIELPEAPGPGAADRRADSGGGGGGGAGGGASGEAPRDALLDLTNEQLQRMQIMHALETTGYKVFGDDGAAKKLDLNPQTLLSRMDKFGIPRPRRMRGAMRNGE